MIVQSLMMALAIIPSAVHASDLIHTHIEKNALQGKKPWFRELVFTKIKPSSTLISQIQYRA